MAGIDSQFSKKISQDEVPDNDFNLWVHAIEGQAEIVVSPAHTGEGMLHSTGTSRDFARKQTIRYFSFGSVILGG